MKRRTAIDLAWVLASAAFFAAVIILTPHKARAATDDELREFMKDVARQRYTEICSAPMPKGEALPQALNMANVEDPKTWGPWIEWWNEVISMRKNAGCGDA